MYSMVQRKKIRVLRKSKFWERRKKDFSRPRLCVFRSSKHIQAQIFDDSLQKVLVSTSSVEKELKSTGLRGKEMAAKVGAIVAEKAIKAGINEIVFDRNGFEYHGRIQILADAARGAGLKF